MPVKKLYLPGVKIGRLTIRKAAPNSTRKNRDRTMWECKCDCGNIHITSTDAFTRSKEPSCGCHRKEISMRLGINQSLPSGEASFNLLFRGYKYKAKDRGLSFNLSKELFKSLTKENCVYCGRSPSNSIMGKFHNGAYIYNGIDRIDNTIGYTEENVVTSCQYCNMAKGTRPVEDFEQWLDQLVEYRNNIK